MAARKLNENTECALVTGATGSIGPALIEELCLSGVRVKAVDLNEPRLDLLPRNVEFIAGDVTQPGFLDSAMPGVNTVFHLAAKLHRFNPPAGLRKEYEHANVAGTRCVIESAQRNAVGRVIFFSTINVYGPSTGRVCDESFLARPEGLYAESKLRAEKIVIEALRPDGRHFGVVLRLAAVYGSRMKGNYERLVKALERGHFVQVGSGTNRRALIHERDVAKAALLASRHPSAAGQVFNVSDGQNHTLKEIISAICSALARKPPQFSLPVWPLRTLLGLWPAGRALLDKYLEDIAVDSSKIQSVLGFAPQFDLHSGWQDAIKSKSPGR